MKTTSASLLITLLVTLHTPPDVLLKLAHIYAKNRYALWECLIPGSCVQWLQFVFQERQSQGADDQAPNHRHLLQDLVTHRGLLQDLVPPQAVLQDLVPPQAVLQDLVPLYQGL